MQGRARRDKARALGVCKEDLHLVGTSAQEPWRKGARGVGRGPVFLVSLLSLCLPDRRQLPRPPGAWPAAVFPGWSTKAGAIGLG